MGEMSMAESLSAVNGAAVGTVFGTWWILESTRGGIEKSIQEHDELDRGIGAASVRCWSSWPANQRGQPLRRGGPGPVSEECPSPSRPVVAPR